MGISRRLDRIQLGKTAERSVHLPVAGHEFTQCHDASPFMSRAAPNRAMLEGASPPLYGGAFDRS
jgi:hypothetical protein